jgi:hypothetical protein
MGFGKRRRREYKSKPERAKQLAIGKGIKAKVSRAHSKQPNFPFGFTFHFSISIFSFVYKEKSHASEQRTNHQGNLFPKEKKNKKRFSFLLF